MIFEECEITSTPTKTEIEIYERIKHELELFENTNVNLYKAFASIHDPVEREAVASKIKETEEDIINKIAEEFDLSLETIIGIFIKVHLHYKY